MAIQIRYDDTVKMWKVAGTNSLAAVKTWTAAVDTARAIAASDDCVDDCIVLTKRNGKVQVFGTKKRASKPSVVNMVARRTKTVTDLANSVYIARVQKNLDSDPHVTEVRATLAEAIKCLPRAARELNWSLVNQMGFDRHTIANGWLVSIERGE